LIDSAGDITSVLAARITTALRLGLLGPDIRKASILIKDMVVTILAALLTWLFVGASAYLLAITLGLKSLSLDRMIVLTMAAGFLAICPLFVLALLLAFGAYKYGWDPDNVVAPVATTIGDFIGVFFLVIILRAIGAI
jgi:mgtE-like transporter